MSKYQAKNVIINRQKGTKIIIPKNKLIKPYVVTIESDINSSLDNKIKKINELTKDINNDNGDFITYLKNKFQKELEYYEYVSKDKIETLACGGFIRCVTFDEQLKYGGMLIKIIDLVNHDKTKLLLRNSRNKMWAISIRNFHLFYKPQDVENQMIRELFINSEYYK